MITSNFKKRATKCDQASERIRYIRISVLGIATDTVPIDKLADTTLFAIIGSLSNGSDWFLGKRYSNQSDGQGFDFVSSQHYATFH
jgi:hypothetical protein